MQVVRSITAQGQAFHPRYLNLSRDVVLHVVVLLLVEAGSIGTGYGRVITTLDSGTCFASRPECRRRRETTTGTIEDIACTLGRILGIFETTGRTERKLHILARLDVDIRTDAILVVAVGGILIDTIFTVSSQVDEIFHLLRTTADTQIHAVQRGSWFQNRIKPIGIRMSPRICTIAEELQILFCIGTRVDFVNHLGILGSVRHLRDTGSLRETGAGVEGYGRLTFLTTFCRNQDNTVGSTRTVDGGGSVLQHRHRFDFIRIQTVHTTITVGHTIDYNQRVLTTERVGTTDTDCRTATTRFVRRLETDDTRHTADHGVRQVRRRRSLQLFTGDAGHGAGNGNFLLRTVTNDHDFIQTFGIFAQGNTKLGFGTNRDVLSLITDIGNLQDGIGGNPINDELTIHIGDRTQGGSLHQDIGSDNRDTRLIDYRTMHGLSLLCQSDNRLYKFFSVDAKRRKRRKHEA